MRLLFYYFRDGNAQVSLEGSLESVRMLISHEFPVRSQDLREVEKDGSIFFLDSTKSADSWASSYGFYEGALLGIVRFWPRPTPKYQD